MDLKRYFSNARRVITQSTNYIYIYIRTKLSINDISRAKIRSACVIVSDLFLRNGTNSSQRCYLRQ